MAESIGEFIEGTLERVLYGVIDETLPRGAQRAADVHISGGVAIVTVIFRSQPSPPYIVPPHAFELHRNLVEACQRYGLKLSLAGWSL